MVRFWKTPVKLRFVVEELELEFDVLPPEKLGVEGEHGELEVHELLAV